MPSENPPFLPARRAFLEQQLHAGLALAGLAAGLSAERGLAAPPTSRQSDLMPGQPATPDSLREAYLTCLGGAFPEPGPLRPLLRQTIQKEGYRIESLSYEVLPDDRIPALLLVPDGISASSPAPAVAVWHQHAGEYHLGKSEPAGLAGNPMHHTAVALAREGYVVICPDALCFEERQDPSGKLKGGNYERFEFLREVVRGRSMAWRNVLDMRRTIDLLCERPEVKADRLGCYGHSMGSSHTWLVGPLEPRLKCLVGNCCLPTYEAIEASHLLHCFPNFVPGWSQYGDTPEIAALIAPRVLHLNLGETDGGSPIDSARRGMARIAEAYQKAGVPDHFTHFIEPGTGHVLTPAMWEEVRKVFARHLA